jgi:hypothetical protein
VPAAVVQVFRLASERTVSALPRASNPMMAIKGRSLAVRGSVPEVSVELLLFRSLVEPVALPPPPAVAPVVLLPDEPVPVLVP